MLSAPRSINSTKPFVSCAQEYVSRGWQVLPLPRRRKEYPPTGFTGRAGKFADESDLLRWLDDVQYFEGNIAIRVGNMLVVNGVKYEVIGIDVDAHSGKRGSAELARLEKAHGKLPDTWISSSRDDGVSGIRFYLVPYGYGFKGKASDSIDIVQRVHRYAVVYPSWHPDTKTQYFWYEPGKKPTGQGFSDEIPRAQDLAILPDEWVDYLTWNRLKDDNGFGADLDSTDDEIFAWVKTTFNSPDAICPYMRTQVDSQLDDIQNSTSAHDKILKAHMHLIKVATEGHSGVKAAIKEIDAAWTEFAVATRERNSQMAKREKRRSLVGALRKIKAKAEGFAEQGFSLFISECCRTSYDLKVNTEDVLDRSVWTDFPRVKPKNAPDDYEQSDWGNAEMFRDIHKGLIHYIVNGFGGWIIWDGEKWVNSNGGIPRTLFRRVKSARTNYAKLLRRKAIRSGNANEMKLAEAYARFAKECGNMSRITRALELASTMQGIEIRQEELNCDRWALGCANGVLRWATKEQLDEGKPAIELVKNTRKFLITKNTGFNYIPLVDQVGTRGYRQFMGFLEAIQPEPQRRDYLQKLLGQCLIGRNAKKIALFFYGLKHTGKTSLLELMLESIGDYGAMRPPRILSPKDLNPLLATSLPMRIVGIDELGVNRVASDLFKTLTGDGTVTVEVKNSNVAVTDVPQFTFIITTNNVPNVPGEDEAFRDRLVVIPFEHKVLGFGGVDPDTFKTGLESYCAEACLAWLVEGCARAIAEGLYPLPDWIVQCTSDFSAQLSDVGTFIRDCIVRTDDLCDFVSNADMQMAWENYCQMNNVDNKGFSGEALSKAIRAHGFWQSKQPVRIESKQHRGWLGINLIEGKTPRCFKLDKPGSKR